MSIATKSGAVILKNGKAAESCGCCDGGGTCACELLKSVKVSFEWFTSNRTAQVLESCGVPQSQVFAQIEQAAVYTLNKVTAFPLETGLGAINPLPGACYYYFKDDSVSGSTTFGQTVENPESVTVQHGLEILFSLQPTNEIDSIGAQVWYGNIYARVVAQVICPLGDQPYADGFRFNATGILGRCGSFTAFVPSNGNYLTCENVFFLSGAFGNSFYQWAVRTLIQGQTE